MVPWKNKRQHAGSRGSVSEEEKKGNSTKTNPCGLLVASVKVEGNVVRPKEYGKGPGYCSLVK